MAWKIDNGVSISSVYELCYSYCTETNGMNYEDFLIELGSCLNLVVFPIP
jgi:hypothetical protein